MAVVNDGRRQRWQLTEAVDSNNGLVGVEDRVGLGQREPISAA